MVQLSYKDIYNRFGKLIVKFLEDNISNQGSKWPGNAWKDKTVITWEKNGKKFKPSGSTHPRMNLTGNTQKNAFKYKAENDKLTIFVNPSAKNISDIFGENNIGGNETGEMPIPPPYTGNSNIKKDAKGRKSHVARVALFPMDKTVSQFEQTEVIQTMMGEFKVFTEDYFQKIVDTDLNKKITIG